MSLIFFRSKLTVIEDGTLTCEKFTSNPELRAALESHKSEEVVFTPSEWDEFGISFVKDDDFINVGDSYFLPVSDG